MTMSKQEYDDIINDTTKVITENIVWEGSPNSPAREFRSDINSYEGYPIFIKGWYNPRAGKLSYAIIHRGVGRIYGLDLGAEHQNPEGNSWERSTKTIGCPAAGINGPMHRRTLPRHGTAR